MERRHRKENKNTQNTHIALLKQSRQKNKRRQCETTIQQLIQEEHISDDMAMQITPIPKTQRNDVWHKYQTKVTNTINKTQKQMSTRARTKWREQMKYFKNKREEQRKSQRPDPENKPLTMFEQTNQGTIIIDGETEIKNKEREVTAKHMGKGRKRNYIKK